MTHDPESNCTMPGIEGQGFVMWFDGKPEEPVEKPQAEPPREVWPGIEDDVAELERLLR